MKYAVIAGTRMLQVEIDGSRLRVDGQAWDATLTRIPGTPLATLRTLRGTRNVVCRSEGDQWWVGLAGEQFVFQVLDERALAAREVAGRQAVRSVEGLVRAPMPGMVLRIEVAEGETVQAGTGLVVLEAMKMENEIRSPGPATVGRIVVAPGQAVEKGTPLVELRPQG